jgi:pimeloyl-ACP methyl ester carboxylesterase
MKKNLVILASLIFITMNLFSQSEGYCPPDTNNKVVKKPFLSLQQAVRPLQEPINTHPYTFSSDSFRMVFWVHGMNGSSSSWIRAATASSSHLIGGDIPGFSPRKIYSYLPDYSNNQYDLTSAALVLKSQLNKNQNLPANYPDSASMIIAHSQGGIVTRAMLYADSLNHEKYRIGGFATFGSPHRGAVGLTGNNRILSYKFFETAANDLSDGYITEYAVNIKRPVDRLNHNFWGRLFNLNIQLPDADTIKNILKKQFLYNPVTDENGFLLSLIRGSVESGIIDELAVGNNSLNLINATQPDMKQLDGAVAFYGVKKPFKHQYTDGRTPLLVEPLWALFHYALNDPNDEYYFAAITDWKLAEKVREAQLDYLEEIHEHNTVIDTLRSYWSIPPWGNCDPAFLEFLSQFEVSRHFTKNVCKPRKRWEKIHDLEDIREAYYVGYYWWDKANLLWATAMGARSKSMVNERVCKCRVHNILFDKDYTFSYIPEIDEACGDNILSNLMPIPDWTKWEILGGWHENIERITHIIDKPYDGAALAESTADLPFRTSDMKYLGTDVSEMDGSGHMQMRNDGNLKDCLNHLFDGHVGSFFNTKKLDE